VAPSVSVPVKPGSVRYEDFDVLVATTSYFNRTTKGAARAPSAFAATVPLKPGKTVASVTLPDVSVTAVSTSTVSMHIFDIEIG
jgi:hypothetical protein